MSQVLWRKIEPSEQDRNIHPIVLENSQITQFFLYGDKNFTASTNIVILNSTIEYIQATKIYEKPLFWNNLYFS